MVLSSPAIASDAIYTPVKGATLSGESVFNGLYLGNLKASGGTDGTSFTVSSSVTKSGDVMMGPGGPGGFPPDGMFSDGVPPDGDAAGAAEWRATG